MCAAQALEFLRPLRPGVGVERAYQLRARAHPPAGGGPRARPRHRRRGRAGAGGRARSLAGSCRASSEEIRDGGRPPAPQLASVFSKIREAQPLDPIEHGTTGSRTVRAPRGTEISCRGWQQEAALRMLMNNLDPEVAERPDDLVVYGGTGRAARSWAAFDAIVRRAARRWRTTRRCWCSRASRWGSSARTAHAPRVLLANSNLVPRWATWEHLPRAGARRGSRCTAR